MLLPNNSKGNEAGTSASAGNSGSNTNAGMPMKTLEQSMNLLMDSVTAAAGNTAKEKRAKEASNRSQARGPIIRKSRAINPGEKNLFQD